MNNIDRKRECEIERQKSKNLMHHWENNYNIAGWLIIVGLVVFILMLLLYGNPYAADLSFRDIPHVDIAFTDSLDLEARTDSVLSVCDTTLVYLHFPSVEPDSLCVAEITCRRILWRERICEPSYGNNDVIERIPGLARIYYEEVEE